MQDQARLFNDLMRLTNAATSNNNGNNSVKPHFPVSQFMTPFPGGMSGMSAMSPMFAAQQMAQMAQFSTMMAMMTGSSSASSSPMASLNGGNISQVSSRVHEIVSDTESVKPVPENKVEVVEIVETVDLAGSLKSTMEENHAVEVDKEVSEEVTAEELKQETANVLNAIGDASDILQDLNQKLEQIHDRASGAVDLVKISSSGLQSPPPSDLDTPAPSDMVSKPHVEQQEKSQLEKEEEQLENMIEREVVKKKVQTLNRKSKQLQTTISKDELLQDQIKMKLDIHHSSVDAVSKTINELQSKIIPLTSLLLKSQRTLMNHQTQMIELSEKASDVSKTLMKKREELHQMSVEVFDLMQSECIQKHAPIIGQGRPCELFPITVDTQGTSKNVKQDIVVKQQQPVEPKPEEDEIKFVDDEDAEIIMQQLNKNSSDSDDDSELHFADFPKQSLDQQSSDSDNSEEEEASEHFPNLQNMKKRVLMQQAKTAAIKHRKLN